VFDTLFGLPVHVLLVHAVVVALPVLALAAVAVAVYGPWRRRLALPLALASFGTSVLAWVTARSGEAFYQRLGMPESAREHTELGETMYWFALALTAALLVLGLLSRRQGMRHAMVALGAVLVFATAGLLTWRVVLVGHSGSAAVWSEIVQNTEAPAD
jgi:hypothetical protein